MAARSSRAAAADRLASLLIAIAAVAAYAPSLGGAFVFDDLLRIPRNPFIRSLWPPWVPLEHTSRPLVQWTLALNYAWSGLAPRGYHALNLAIHVLAALALAWLARRTLEGALPESYARAGRARGLAFAIALLWAVHPLGTQAVAYVIQRSEALMALGYLLALGCLARAAGSRHPGRWQLAAVACALLGAASKSVIVSLPIVALLYDRAYLAGSFREALRARRRAHAGFALAALAALALLAAAPEEWRHTAGLDARGMSWGSYLATEPGVILHYLRLALWPRGLVFDYGWPVAHGLGPVALPALALAALAVAASVGFARRPGLWFPALAFLLVLAPTSGLVPISDPAYEHRMYLPLAAVVALAVIGGDAALRAWLPAGAARVAGAALAVALALVLGVATAARTRVYASERALWTDTVAKRPQNARARGNLGKALEDEGLAEDARVQYRAAVALDPSYAEARNNLGHLLDRQGQADQAIALYREALRLDPELALAHSNLGAALARGGDFAAAEAELGEALRLDPGLAEAHYNLGVMREHQGRLDEAQAAYRAALAARPDYAGAHHGLGVTLARAGRLGEAVAELREAARLAPARVETRFDLGHALALAGDRAGARSELEAALRFDPGFEPARRELEALEKLDR